MIEILALVVSVLAALGSAWMYWQVQRMEQRLQEKEAHLGEKVALVNELADELVIASRYLYDAMDRCIARIDALENQLLSAQQEAHAEAQTVTASAQERLSLELEEAPSSPSASGDGKPAPELGSTPSALVNTDGTLPATAEPEAEEATLPTRTAEATPPEAPAEPSRPLSVHAQALVYAAQGEDLVEIARKTGLGVEELRLLLRFQGLAEQAA